MFLIERVQFGGYVFGNKTYTYDRKHARKFSTWEEAKGHIDQWFSPGTHIIHRVEELGA